MSKMEFLDPLEAEKFTKQKCIQFCWTPCTTKQTQHRNYPSSYTHYPLKPKPGKPYKMTTKGKFSALQCPQNNVFTTKYDQHLYLFQLLRALRNIVQLGLGLS